MAHTVALGDRGQRLTSRSAFDGLLEQRHQFIARRPAQFRLQRSHIRNVVHGQSLTRPQIDGFAVIVRPAWHPSDLKGAMAVLLKRASQRLHRLPKSIFHDAFRRLELILNIIFEISLPVRLVGFLGLERFQPGLDNLGESLGAFAHHEDARRAISD